MKEKTIIKISSSAVKDSACDVRYDEMVNRGLTEKLKWNDTFYGTCFHTFAYVMAMTNGDFAMANAETMAKFRKTPTRVREKKEHLTEKHLINTCIQYWSEIESARTDFEPLMHEALCHYCGGTSIREIAGEKHDCNMCEAGHVTVPIAEFNFSIPVFEDEDFIVLFEGTIDRMGKIKNGAYCIRDFKTTSSWDWRKFLESFRASGQLKLYIWALKKHAQLNPGSALDALTKFPLVAFVDGIFLKSAKETEFHSEGFQFKDWELQEMETMLLDKAKKIVELKFKGDLGESAQPTGKITGLCYTGFFCKYFNVCHALDSVVRKHIIANQFTNRTFDPLNYDGE
jgi:hypothetical protein